MARTDGITMNNYKLPFSLTPAEGESVQGYLARLAIENCCADTKDLEFQVELAPTFNAPAPGSQLLNVLNYLKNRTYSMQ